MRKKIKQKKFLVIFIVLLVVFFFAYYIEANSKENTVLLGLPEVSCVDPYLPIKQQFIFFMKINIDGANIYLDKNIGHDPGNCLRSIYTNDSSGLVSIESNEYQNYTLNNFFDVWRKNFSKTRLMDKKAENGKIIKVYVNDIQVDTYEDTVIPPNSRITIIYQ